MPVCVVYCLIRCIMKVCESNDSSAHACYIFAVLEIILLLYVVEYDLAVLCNLAATRSSA
jgi:hypothetical protein